MPKKLSKRKVTKSKKKISKRKISKRILRKRNPPLGFINTSDNKDAALAIEGIDSEPLIGGIIIKFYLLNIKRSFDILIYNEGVNFMLEQFMTGKYYMGNDLPNFGYANIGAGENYTNKIIDVDFKKLIGGVLIILYTNYISPRQIHLKLRSKEKGSKIDPLKSAKYIITLYDDGVKLLKQLLVQKRSVITKNQIDIYGDGKWRASSGIIEDFKPISILTDE